MMDMKMENLPTYRADGKSGSKERGFTLIEVLIAVFILTVGLMAMGAVLEVMLGVIREVILEVRVVRVVNKS